jgi:hypothetical protein
MPPSQSFKTGSGGIAGLSKTPHFIDLPRGLKPAIFRAVASSPDNRSLADCIADIAALACDVFFLFYRNFWTPGHHGYIMALRCGPVSSPVSREFRVAASSADFKKNAFLVFFACISLISLNPAK